MFEIDFYSPSTESGHFVIVTLFEECINGDVRLVNGGSGIQGRVEICLDAVFGTVCNVEWDDEDAAVVCRQLGFTSSPSEGYKLTCICECVYVCMHHSSCICMEL